MNRLICGVGVNDADYVVDRTINGKRITCPFYQKWKSMLSRGYSKKYHSRYPTYKDVVVCDEWLRFSNFKVWMIAQPWEGNHLDKDIIIPGNKIYGQETCCFVSQYVNNLIPNHPSQRGEYPLGVSIHRRSGKFKAKCRTIDGKSKHLGYFNGPGEAHKAYIKYKSNLINTISNQQSDERIANGLRMHAELILGCMKSYK